MSHYLPSLTQSGWNEMVKAKHILLYCFIYVQIQNCSHIYWSSFGGATPKIERANTDGTGRFILVDENINVPHGLTIDFQGRFRFDT